MALLRRASHTLKSESANVGAVPLSSLCKELEEIAHADDRDGAAASVGAVLTEYRRVDAALRAQLPPARGPIPASEPEPLAQGPQEAA
jgi:HPt (histidine-containing phosphotransfer) domain-containing protein